MNSKRTDTLGIVLRVARNPLFGAVVASVGILVLVASGRDAWAGATTALGDASVSLVVVAGVSFGAGTFMLAIAATYALGGYRAMLFGSMASQALKYVPGSVWQTSFVFAEATIQGVAVFASVTLFTAALALSVSGSYPIQFVGLVGVVGLFSLAVRRLGIRRASIVGLLAIGAATFIVGSGIAVSTAIGGSVSLGFDLGTSWAVGVLAVPVPAGLGVREGALALVADADGALIVAASALHRLATTSADAVIGGAGVMLWRQSRRSL